MAKDRKDDEKKLKKDKKEKLSEANGVRKEKKDKKAKKDKHDKKAAAIEAGDPEAATALLNKLESEKPGSVAVDSKGDAVVKVTGLGDGETSNGNGVVTISKELLVGAMVPFANPLADEKQMKKLLKATKRAAKNRAIKRGVKECVKALRKMGDSRLQQPPAGLPRAVVIIAADISPMDVISHIPVLCEDQGIPYMFVPSRAELGEAGSTKRPTSIVMLLPHAGKKKDTAGGEVVAKEKDDAEPWEETYKELAKLVEKASKTVLV